MLSLALGLPRGPRATLEKKHFGVNAVAWDSLPYLEVLWQLPFETVILLLPLSLLLVFLCAFLSVSARCVSLCVSSCPSLLSLASPLLRWGLERALIMTTMQVSN